MPAQETHGFDLVLEIAEDKIQETIATVFESEGLACALVAAYQAGLAAPLGDCDNFVLTIEFDRPVGIPLPGGARNPVLVTVVTGDPGGAAGTRTRMVVGFDAVDVAVGGDTRTVIQLNFRDELYFAETFITLLGTEQPFPGDEAQVIRDTLPPIAVVAIPVEPGATEPERIVAAEPFIVDDTTTAGRDALAAGITAGGGSAGDPTQFVRSFVPPGSTGALGIAFEWLCRVVDPRVEAAFGLPAGRIQGCKLTQPTRITVDGEQVELAEFELTLGQDELRLVAKVKDSGTCWDATGTVSARIKIGVQNGAVTLTPEIDEPEVSTSVPWECWVVGAVLAAFGVGVWVLASVIVGVIIVIIAAIALLILLLIELTMDTLESVVESLSDALEAALGTPEGVSIPVALLDFDLVAAQIDDITLGFDVVVKSGIAVRGEGDLYVPIDHAVDLDTGAVGPADLVGGDLLWTGEKRARRLETLCAAELARSGRGDLDDAGHYVLRLLGYEAPATVSLGELFIIVDTPTFDAAWPTFRVFGVRTTEGRLAAVQAIALTHNYVVLRYRTYERRGPSVSIGGGFRCARKLLPVTTKAWLEEGTPGTDRVRPTRRPPVAAPPIALPTSASGGVSRVASIDLLAARRAMPTRVPVRPTAPTSSAGSPTWLGRWRGGIDSFHLRTGVFRVVHNHLTAPLSVQWAIDSTALTAPSGTVAVDGGRVAWSSADTEAVALTVDPDGRQVEFMLEVTVVDADSRMLRATRCIHWDRECSDVGPAMPSLEQLTDEWKKRVGLDLVPLGPKRA